MFDKVDNKNVPIVEDRNSEIQKRIHARRTMGQSFSDVATGLATGKAPLKTLGATMDIIGSPLSLPIAAVSNVGVGINRGDIPVDPFRSIKQTAEKDIGLAALQAPFSIINDINDTFLKASPEVVKGLIGEKRANVSDVLYGRGVNKLASDVAGFGIEALAPLGLLNLAKRELARGATLITDKNLSKAGKFLNDGTRAATDAVTKKTKEAFKDYNKIEVDKAVIRDVLKSLPKIVRKEIGEVTEFTVEKLRDIKRIIGLAKGDWKKSAKGLKETFQGIDLKKAYKKLEEELKNTLTKNAGNETASKLMDIEDSASKVYGSAEYMKQVFIGKTGQPTKAGRAAELLRNRKDLTFRDSVKILKNASKDASENLNKSIDSLTAFNKWQDRNAVLQKMEAALPYIAGGWAINRSIQGVKSAVSSASGSDGGKE